ncbi:MAG: GNAT family N-acetyltransferase [Bacteroidetes bacterium]|nr:GNAT family N-acetyltransferase [Bacteroidota bacterium]
MDFRSGKIGPGLDFDFLPVFRTSRLILRHVGPENFEQLLLHENQDAVRSFLNATDDLIWAEQLRRFSNGLSSWNNSFCHFFLFSSDTLTPVGYCGFHQMHPGHRKAELGYSLYEEHFKRQGLMTEAVDFVIQYGFDTLKLIRIEAMTGTDNVASTRILEKKGFQKEGFLRKNYLRNGMAEDSVMFALLNEKELELLGNKA